MTFLCTRDGELVPGERERGDGRWPQPWGFECDDCHRRFPYGCVVTSPYVKTLRPPTMRHVSGDTHRCAYCDGYVDPDVQLDLFGASTEATA